jgi:hypothetical protein
MKHLRTGFVGIATAFCGIAACQEAVAPVWVKALATENNALKVSREGNVASNGTLAWTVADGKPLISYNSHCAIGNGNLYGYLHAFALNHDGSIYYFGKRNSGLWNISNAGVPFHVDVRNYLWYDMSFTQEERDVFLTYSRYASDYSLVSNRLFPGSLEGPPRQIVGLRDGCFVLSGPSVQNLYGGSYDKGFSMYPIALAPDWSDVLQMSAAGVTCYRLIDGVQLWTKSITNLATYHISILSDSHTFVYNTMEGGVLTANFCDMSDGHIKGSNPVPAPVQAASPVDNNLFVQWSWPSGLDPYSPHFGTPAPTAVYAFDPNTNTCSFVRNLVEVEPSWTDMRRANLRMPAGLNPVVVSNLAGTHTISLRRSSNGSFIRTLPLGVNDYYAFSPDGASYAVNTQASGVNYLEIRRTTNGASKIKKALTVGSDVFGIWWSSGSRLMVEETGGIRVYDYDGTHLVLVKRIANTHIAQGTARISPDGTLVAFKYAGADNVNVHYAASGDQKFQIATPYTDVRFVENGSLAIHKGGPATGATGSMTVNVDLYDVSGASPALTRSVQDVLTGIKVKSYDCYDVSPDGQYIVIGDGNDLLYPLLDPSVNAAELDVHFHVYRTSDGAEIKNISYPFSVAVNPYIRAVFTPDSKNLQIYSHPVVYSVAVP